MKIPTHDNPAAPDLEAICAGRRPPDLTWIRELLAAVRRFHEADG